MAEEIKAMILVLKQKKKLRINFCRVPTHAGIVRNEKAEAAAKEAAINENNPTLGSTIPHTDMKR